MEVRFRVAAIMHGMVAVRRKRVEKLAQLLGWLPAGAVAVGQRFLQG